MFRVSNLLKNARTDKDLDYTEVSKKLKIPAKYLEAIENEHLKDFPSEPYCSLIVKDYANFLGLNGEEVLSLFRRDFDRKIASDPDKKSILGFTPHFTFTLGVIVTVIFFTVYLAGEYLKYNRPPDLNVNWPQTTTVNTDSIEIQGTTDPESTVRVNQELVIVDETGAFQEKVNLNPPETKIVIESKSPSGKTTIKTKTYQVKF